MAHNYPKITSPFKRTDAKSKTVNVGVWFDDYAKFFGENGLPFYATEKVDGTNLNIVYDGNHIQYTGHTDKTVWDPEVEEWIKSKFQTPEFEQICEQLFGEHEIKLCGELIGPKIQSNFYKLEDYKFILFDIHNNTTNAWWSREKVEQIAKELNLDIVPVIGETTDTLRGWVNYLHNYKFISKFNNDVEIEGFVVRPLMEILKADGERVIYKIKINDILGRFRYMNI
jgi:ATP-dependent RNA circularization protein (DNA/RNA ligase family)